MRVLLTGASGFIGTHVLDLLLKDGHELLAVSRKRMMSSKHKGQLKTLKGDLADIGAIAQRVIAFDPQVCVHLAWEGIPDYGSENSRRNMGYSLDLIDLLVQRTDCRKIIISGSSWEYGKQKGVCRESERTLTTSAFTWAKKAVHDYGRFSCGAKGVDFIWFRVFFAFGPGQRAQALIPTIVEAIRQGRKPDIKNPSNAQDFVYIGDVAEAFRLAVKKNVPSGIYNIGRGQVVSVREICRLVQQGLKVHGDVLFDNGVGGAASVRTWADISKMTAATGWRPRTDLKNGIKKHIDAMERV